MTFLYASTIKRCYAQRAIRARGHISEGPEWTPPEKPEKGGNGILGGGGNDTSKEPPRAPAELRRAWSQRVKKAALADGDGPLPQDGLLYFSYSGKVNRIRSDLLQPGR
jgi:hypothetical protein